MTLRGLLLADGPSDLPLAEHLESLCAEHGREVEVTPIDPRTLGAPNRTVEARLRFLLSQNADPDLVFVHRDAEARDPLERVEEVRHGAVSAGVSPARVVPVVPVRMTEAWLLLDEAEIRRVAGRPGGTNRLNLPRIAGVETLADPKERLRDVLLVAGQPRGRRRREQFGRDFGRHRALLLQRLDLQGPINDLEAWRRLKGDIADALAGLPERDGSS